MTLYSIFVSNEPLEVLDQREISETTVGEMRKHYNVTEGTPEPFWYSLDDSTILVNAPSEESFHQLLVFHWGNPPSPWVVPDGLTQVFIGLYLLGFTALL